MKKIRIMLIMIFFIFVFVLLNMLLQPKYATSLVEGNMISSYYMEDKNHDVIFVGDCEVYANFSPMIIYEETGVKSFVRGSSQQLMWQSYQIIKETLKYEKPKMLVLNINSMRYDKNSNKVNEAYNRLTIDKMKWSKEKINIINESMTDDENFISYIFPIIRYHSRFDKLTKEDFKYLFKRKDSTFNGFLVNKKVKPLKNLPLKKSLSSYNFSKENYKYLDLITEICKQNNVELVLIKAPSVYPYWYDEYDAQIRNYANENDLKYYNLYERRNEIGIDYNIDTYDGGLHLNLNGATKLSKYFANILKEEYNMNYDRDTTYDYKLKKYYDYIK